MIASPATRRYRLLALSLPELWAFLAVALPVVGALIAPMSTVDLAYQVRAGQLMIEQGAVLRTDPFTFTAGAQPWLDQQWAAQVVLGGLYEIGGWALLAIVRALLVGGIFWLVYRLCRDAGVGQRPAAGLALAAFTIGAASLALRPQLFGMALFALTAWLVTSRQHHPRRLWLVPLVVAGWANLHGSFFLGPALLGLAWLEDRRGRRPGADRTLLVALIAATAAALNPWGFGVWQYAVGLSADPTIRRLITEWQVTSPFSFAGAAFYLSVAGALGAVIVAWRRRPALISWPALLWLAVLAAIGAYAERGVAWWAIGAPPVLAAILVGGAQAGRDARQPVPPVARPERRSIVNGLIALAIAAAGVLAWPSWRAVVPADGPLPLLADAPTGITQAVRARATPADRVFVPQRLGSWFEFALPGVPVFVDSRIELFPTEVWDDYLAVSAGEPGWQTILDRWGVTVVVVAPADQPGLAGRIRADPGWHSVYEGEDGLVFERRRDLSALRRRAGSVGAEPGRLRVGA